jgi:hypothetical protein
VVALPATRRWAVGVGDPGVLVPVHGRTLPRGVQGLFAAAQPAVTQLYATDVTPCRSRCTPPPDSFAITVIVRP